MIPPQGFGETGENERNKETNANLFFFFGGGGGGQRNKDESGEQWIQEIMEDCGGKDKQSNLFKGNNDTDTIIFLISLQSKPTRSVDKVFVCRSRDHNS